MKKKHKVVMLATDSPNAEIQYVGESDSIYLNPNNPDNPNDIIDNLGVPRHLYILSDDEIKEDDWFIQIHNAVMTVVICDKQNKNVVNTHQTRFLKAKKIIATTDPKLNRYIENNRGEGVDEIFPQIPQSFIESYTKNPVEYVELEYEEYNLKADIHSFDGESYSYDLRPKLVNNEVVIHEVKEKLYTKDDLMKLHEHICEQASHYVITINECEQWIKDNL